MSDHGFVLRAALIARQGRRGRAARWVNAAGRLVRALRGRRMHAESGPAMRRMAGADGLLYLVPQVGGREHG